MMIPSIFKLYIREAVSQFTRIARAKRPWFIMIELYCGHRVRVANQQVHLDKIINDMEMECLDKKNTLVVTDWKMKFEPMSS